MTSCHWHRIAFAAFLFASPLAAQQPPPSVFDAVSIQVGGHGRPLRGQGTGIAELLVHEVVVGKRRNRSGTGSCGRLLRRKRSGEAEDYTDEKEMRLHLSTLVPPTPHEQSLAR